MGRPRRGTRPDGPLYSTSWPPQRHHHRIGGQRRHIDLRRAQRRVAVIGDVFRIGSLHLRDRSVVRVGHQPGRKPPQQAAHDRRMPQRVRLDLLATSRPPSWLCESTCSYSRARSRRRPAATAARRVLGRPRRSVAWRRARPGAGAGGDRCACGRGPWRCSASRCDRPAGRPPPAAPPEWAGSRTRPRFR